MPNGTPFEECAVEIAPMASNLRLVLSAKFYEDEEAAVPAPNIVYADETYYVKVDWWFEGAVAFARHFCGMWQVKIDLESIGTAPEYTSNLVDIAMDPCNMGEVNNPYTYTFRLSPGDVKPHEGGTVYIVAVTLSTLDVCGDTGHIWGYCKGASVMFVPGKPHD